MKRIITALQLVMVFLYQSVNAQTFEIPSVDKNVFYDIIEWKGMGSLLMSRDPLGNTKQITLTLVTDTKTSVWDQKFNPKSEEFYYIASENARYVYFLDNLNLEDGKVYFSQLNSAGNIKSTSVAVGAAVKKIKNIDYNDLELINVVVTDKALVHHFRYEDKSTKSVVEFATFITHHNFLCYAVELATIPKANFKDENIGSWDYIGFTGDEIFFAARDVIGKKKGWSVKSFSSKGKEMSNMFIDAPDHELISVENIGFGTTGKHYLKTDKMNDRGLLAQINGSIYLLGGKRGTGSATLELFKYEAGEWKLLNQMQLNYFIENKALKLGIYPMNEGIGYHLDHNGYNKVSMISFDKKTEVAHNSYTEKTVYNPSAVFNLKEKSEFTVSLPTEIQYFNIEQLGKEGAVTFEFVSR